MSDLDGEEATRERLKAAVYYAVGQGCESLAQRKSLVFDKDTMAAISETIWSQMPVLGSDLEMFAKHAKRSTVTPEDVLLLARRNDKLLLKLTAIAQQTSKSSAAVPAGPATKVARTR
eukprot:Clim_evm26s47 gene=Clim_evmTU26s47